MSQGRRSAEEVKQTYEVAFARLAAESTDGISERLASLCAAVEAAGHLANDVLDLGWNVSRIVDQAFESILGNRDAGSVQTSIEVLGDFWATHKDMFNGTEGVKTAPNARQKAFGRTIGETDGFDCLAVLPPVVEKVLKGNGFDYRSTIAHWSDRGWLLTDKNRRTKKVRFNGEPTNMIVLSPTGLLAAKGGDDWDEDILSELACASFDLDDA